MRIIEKPTILELTRDDVKRLCSVIGRTSPDTRIRAKIANSIDDDPLSELYDVLIEAHI